MGESGADVSGPDAATVAEGGISLPAAPPRFGPGTCVGRYMIVETIGQGGMGRVLRAYDPKLRREVAVKLLHATPDATARARIIREAQSMARLSHPNIVAVHDVDHDDGVPFIVMEYVEGESVHAWLQGSRSVGEIIDAFVAAGRGLAAAHAAGLVHRDVKPMNLLRDPSGRVLVTDFGIARSLGEAVASVPPAVDDREHVIPAVLTEAGTVIGTPGYMAPEQHEGRDADARSDQYALCVALWEALAGVRPFAGANMREAIAAKLTMRMTPALPGRGIPGYVRAALRKGMAPAADDRHPSIAALVQALARGRVRARLVWAAGFAGLAAMTGLGAWGYARWDRQQRIDGCEAEGAAIAEVWNDDVRAALTRALVDASAGYGAATAEKALPWIDDQAARWQRAATATCLDESVEHTWDTALAERSRWCLDERRDELRSVVRELGRGGAKAVERAVLVASALQQLESCRDLAALARMPMPPPETKAEIASVRRELADASALSAAGAYEEAVAATRSARARADAIGWAPLQAQALHLLGEVLAQVGDYEAAASELEDAYFAATTSAAPEIALDAAEDLVFVVGVRSARPDDGERWSRHAEAILDGLVHASEIRRATHLNNRATVAVVAARYAEAQEMHEGALAIRERVLGAEHPVVAESLNNLAVLHHRVGAFAEAEALHGRALAIREQTLGPGHPVVASDRMNLAAVYFETGEYATALRHFEHNLAIVERTHDREGQEVGDALTNVAGAQWMLGSHAAATRTLERVLAIRERGLAADDPNLASSLHNLAAVYAEAGDFARALPLLERALAIFEKRFGPEHAEVAATLTNLGDARQHTGAVAQAKLDHARAIALWEKAGRPDHPDLAHPLLGLARGELIDGDAAEAVRLAERALALREAGHAPKREIANAELVLARALWEAGGDRRRALGFAERARDCYREDPAAARDLAEAERWIAAHPLPA